MQQVALTRSSSTYEGSVTPFLTGLKNPLPLTTTPDGRRARRRLGDWATGIIYRSAKR